MGKKIKLVGIVSGIIFIIAILIAGSGDSDYKEIKTTQDNTINHLLEKSISTTTDENINPIDNIVIDQNSEIVDKPKPAIESKWQVPCLSDTFSSTSTFSLQGIKLFRGHI